MPTSSDGGSRDLASGDRSISDGATADLVAGDLATGEDGLIALRIARTATEQAVADRC